MEFEGFLESGHAMAELVTALVKDGRFRPFTKMDWSAFAGCTSFIPMIAETTLATGDDLLVILDGNVVQLFWTNDDKWNQGPSQLFEGNNEEGWNELSREEGFGWNEED